jgi:hypothetical protein
VEVVLDAPPALVEVVGSIEDGAALWDMIVERGMEGVVAKRAGQQSKHDHPLCEAIDVARLLRVGYHPTLHEEAAGLLCKSSRSTVVIATSRRWVMPLP